MATNPKQYADLRTMLDSLEVGALRFFLNGTGMPQGQKFTYLEGMLRPTIDLLWHQQQGATKQVDTECPPGYYDCDGCCVPYKCPELSLTTPRKPKAKATKRKS
jgi:hypothetical protein